MKRLTAIFVVLMLTAGTAFAGQTGAMLSKESIVEKIQKQGVLRVGMSTFVPWAMKDKNGELIGFEIDVAKKLAKDMGVKIEFVPTAWSGIIPALLTGKFDVIIGGMGITPERNLKVNFTMPYEFSGMSMVAHKKKADGFSGVEDFNKKEVTIAVRMGTTAEQAARKFMPKAQFKLFVPIKENFTKEPIGFALRKGDYDALNFFNNWILINHASGFLKERQTYWFETKEWERLVQ